jgi:hypothetical protein
MTSTYFATNSDAKTIVFPSTISTNPFTTRFSNCWKTDSRFKLLINITDFIGLEISLVPQVEQVFVSHNRASLEYRVLTIVNERDADLRKSIYARERVILEEYPHLNFDFHIVARRNRDLNNIVTPSGTLVFKR